MARRILLVLLLVAVTLVVPGAAQRRLRPVRAHDRHGEVVTSSTAALANQFGRLRTPVQGPDGALYVTTSNGSNDRILRVSPS